MDNGAGPRACVGIWECGAAQSRASAGPEMLTWGGPRLQAPWWCWNIPAALWGWVGLGREESGQKVRVGTPSEPCLSGSIVTLHLGSQGRLHTVPLGSQENSSVVPPRPSWPGDSSTCILCSLPRPWSVRRDRWQP